MKRLAFIVYISLGLTLFAGCEKVQHREAGEVYSINAGDGTYKAAKVLGVNDSLIFCKVYSNSFQWRPKSLDNIALSTRFYGARDFVALYRSIFEGWHPQLLGSMPLSASETNVFNRMWTNNSRKDTLLEWQRMSNSDLPEVDYGQREYWTPKPDSVE